MAGRVVKVVVGVLLVAGGIALGAVPLAPGFPLIILGVATILSQSEPGRRVIKRGRLWARERFGSERVREVERKLPSEVIGEQDTHQMRIDLDEYERRREAMRRKRRGSKG